MAETLHNFNFTLAGFNASAIFPVTNFEVKLVASEIVVNFYCSDGSGDPDDCLPIVFSKQGVQEFLGKGGEFIKNANMQILDDSHYRHLLWKQNDAERLTYPRRMNVLQIAGINDLVDIAFAYMSGLDLSFQNAIKDKSSSEKKVSPILLNTVAAISLSKDLFSFLYKELSKSIK